MESHVSRQYTLAELEPGWPEDLLIKLGKSSPRSQGTMRMALRKVSRTPENSRAYAHGDPVSLIDWKAFGRTDELIVREHRDEGSARVIIVVDKGATLGWPTRQDIEFHGGIREAISKSELSIRLALYFAYAHLNFGDTVTLACIEGGAPYVGAWTPRSPAEILRVHETCIRQGFPETIWSFMAKSGAGGEAMASRFDVGWLLTDFLGEGFQVALKKAPEQAVQQNFNGFDEQISRLLRSKVVRVLHTFSWLETSADWMDGATSYRDDVRGQKIYLGDQLKMPAVWKREIAKWRSTVESRVKALGGNYLAVDDRMKVSDLFHWVSKEAVVTR